MAASGKGFYFPQDHRFEPVYAYDDYPGEFQHRSARMKVPSINVIPDLRFEYSYVRSIQRYVKLTRTITPVPPSKEGGEDDEASYEKVELVESEQELSPAASTALVPVETIEVEWKKVLWTTARDQLISPFLQGALWAIASFYLSPFSSEAGAKLGTFVRSKLPSKEGKGVSFLRKYAGAFGVSSRKEALS
ncbi:hypothetical protein CC1G_11078 [Coprinopsis cinerea okayama7|uniref:Uncharacterized protein n=1 Tax=Coprinopsis cinerea (strain Okayama-7 / 130 / ATCC MYA-4618 / FGSC 9003) TaxID=240176 RepID=A8NCA9_COPC7|nr:hypothetical protein CC1G_11078 [Coprinopsis cinerea okayama7\|eukprot:XP_001832453.1 hypothetical protein CC1G_11078 [Coprinopsis cinerea okayama7\